MKNLKLFASVLLLASVQWVAAEVTITGQPKNTSVSPGATARFTVLATSTEPSITYQWWFKDAALDVKDIPSAATYQLFLTNVTIASAGPYFAIANDSSGSATSQVAALTVDPTFTKITTGPVVNDLGSWDAPTWWDYDNDGFVDLYVANASVGLVANVHDALYHNNGDGWFTRVTTNAIGTRLGQSMDGAVGDYNNDGYEDLLAVHFQTADDLYRNDGEGNFTRLTKSQAGPPVADADNSIDAGWADYDRDGFIDLFVANAWDFPGNDCLYRNNGDGIFTKMTTNQVGMLVRDNARTGPCAWVDYDNDGYPDLWVGRAMRENPISGRQDLYHNSRNGTFSKVSAGSLDLNVAGGLGFWADYDNDGHLDVFLGSWNGTNSLHRNVGGKTFADVSKEAGVAKAMKAWPAAWGDYDNDGFLDLLVVGYENANQSILYHNNGEGAFTSVDVGSPLREGGNRVGVAWADYDNDGFLDLLITCGDGTSTTKNLLYHNTGNSNRWLKIKPVGIASNRSAIGAKVRVNATIDGKNIWQTREISGNSGYSGGAGGLLAHFGLGDATNVMTLRIEWPSGNVQELTDVAPNQFLTVREAVGITPTNPSPSLNGSVTLTRAVDVAGASYQWQFGGADLPGQTNRTLVLANVQQGQQGRYSVVVTTADQTLTNYVYLKVDATFTKITSGSLVTDLGSSSGAAWGDFDGDGYADVFVSRYKTGLSTFYHNDRDGTFIATTTLPSQTSLDSWWSPALAADFDNDGKLDLFAPREGKPGFFYFNNGDGTFTASQFQSATSWNTAAADYDRDGLLDLYLSNVGRLFRNKGDRTFTRTSSIGGMFGGATWVDYDDDGWAELFCAGNSSPSRVFHNDGTGRFVPVDNLLTHGFALSGAWGDYDNDGRLDLCAAAFNGPTYVYRNLGNGEFERAAIGQTISGAYNSAAWADYDNDGFLDLFLTTSPQNVLYHNNGDGTLNRIRTGSVVSDVMTGGTDLFSYSGLWFDYDNDGFLDLYVCNANDAGTARTANFLYHNNGNSNVWLEVKLIGTASNHDGVGAKVRVQANYAGQVRWQRRDISAGDALNGNQLYAHFGLGDATNVTTLRIEWPSGAMQELENVAPKQFLTVWEPPALKAAIQSDGACLLTVTAQPNRSWRIEASADLETWQELSTQTHTTPGFEDTTPVSVSMARRFYRVVGE